MPPCPCFWRLRVRDGRIQMTVVSPHGKEGVIAMLGAGEFFGEECLAGQAHHTASAIATCPSTLIRVERPAMIRLLHEQPALAETFMAFLLSRSAQIQADLVDQLFNSSEQRLARVLLLLANFGRDNGLEGVIPRISQEVLAARIGTTRSRINFFMNKFRKRGFIEYDGTPHGVVKVHSSLVNAVVDDQHRSASSIRHHPR